MSARTADSWRQPPRLPDSHFVSGAVYTDRSIFEDEKRTIFERCWHFVCHESELPQKHDFRTVDYVGKPLLITRGGDGVVRGFLNVCSHRGAKLVLQPSGNTRRFTCFYHLWTYDDQGSCIDIPREDGYKTVGLDKESCGLRSVRTETFLGLVFINLDDAAEPLSGYINDALTPFAEPLGSGLLEVFHFNRAILKSNWKAWQETNLDVYHEWMHVLLRQTQIGAGRMDDRKVSVFPKGHTSVGGLKASYKKYQGMDSREAIRPLPGLAPDDFFFVDLFPNFAILARGTAIRIDTVTPIDEETTLVEWRGLGLKSDNHQDRLMRWGHHNQYWGPFGRNVPEDAFAAEACDSGFRHGAAAYEVIARDEGGSGQDDGMLRAWYAEWSARTGRSAAQPTNNEIAP